MYSRSGDEVHGVIEALEFLPASANANNHRLRSLAA